MGRAEGQRVLTASTPRPTGEIYYVSLAGSFLGKPDLESGETVVIEPKTAGAGTRRVWSDSKGRLWVSEWNAGNLSVYDPATKTWQVFKLPGEEPHAYAVFVDDKDKVWVSDFAANAILKLRPRDSEAFESFPSDQARCRRAPDARPARRNVGRGVRHRPAGGISARSRSSATSSSSATGNRSARTKPDRHPPIDA